jgi:hypothetical protein
MRRIFLVYFSYTCSFACKDHFDRKIDEIEQELMVLLRKLGGERISGVGGVLMGPLFLSRAL